MRKTNFPRKSRLSNAIKRYKQNRSNPISTGSNPAVQQVKQEIKEEVKQELKLNPIINRLARGVGGMGTTLLGLGADLGNNIGDQAHKLFKEITGYGDYTIKSNSLVNNTGAPLFKPSDRVLHLRHREFLFDLYSGPTLTGGSTDFQNGGLLINPSNALLFPWLSTVAKNFQQYRFKGLIFTFESKSGSSVSSTNTTLGSIIMSTNYNVHAPPFINKQQMEAHEFTTSCKPSENMIHPLECSPKEQVCQHHFVLNRQLVAGEDKKFYFPGFFQIATVGMQAALVNLGEMWVSYDIELLKPRKDITQFSAHWQCSGALQANYAGTTRTLKYGDTQIVSLDANGLFKINAGFYGLMRMQVVINSPGGKCQLMGPSTLTGKTALSLTYLNDTAGEVSSISANNYIQSQEFIISGGGTVQIAAYGLSAADAAATMDVFFDAVVQDDLY